MNIVVVIPIYNESKRIPDSIATLKKWSATMSTSGYLVSFLFVDDGSNDNSFEILSQCELPSTLIRLENNLGKGGAVRHGILHASECDYILVMDVDLSTSLNCVTFFINQLKQMKLDVIVADRFHPNSFVNRSFMRSFISYTYLFIVHGLFSLKVIDTQCGFKLFRSKVAKELFKHVSINGFCFEVEMILLAQENYRIGSAPVHWVDTGGSSIRLLRDSIRMLKDLLLLRSRHQESL